MSTPDKGPNPFDTISLVGRVDAAAGEFLETLAGHLAPEERVQLVNLQYISREWFVLAEQKDTAAFLARADELFDALQVKYRAFLKPKII